MKLRRLYTISRLAAVVLLLLAAATGCSYVREDGVCDEDDAGDSQFYISLSIVTSQPSSTRASGSDIHTDDTQEPGSPAENYIDFAGGDFQLVLFDNAGDYLMSIGADGEWKPYPMPSPDSNSSNEYARYTMKRKIEFSDEIENSRIENIKLNGFQVLVLANWRNAKGKGSGEYKNLENKTLSYIWAESEFYNFQYDYTSVTGGYETWRPKYQNGLKLIPMFGYVKAPGFKPTTNGGELLSSATIHMQRAVAKIEVIGNMKDQPSLSVEDVTMTEFNVLGRFIPNIEANPNWDKEGSQVGVSSLPNADAFNKNPSQYNLKFFHITEGVEGYDGVDKFVAYVPEMDLSSTTSLIGNTKMLDTEKAEKSKADGGRPHLKVAIINNNPDSALDYKGGTYAAHFAKYDSDFNPTIPDESWKHILRNHIYRFYVNKVGLTVQLHLHVIPWYLDDDEVWDFTDHVTVQQLLDWNPSSCTDIDRDTGEILLKLDESEGPLEGSFRISTPLNGRWYARLTPMGDAKTDAISFTNKDGKIIDRDGNVVSVAPGEQAPACLEISGFINNAEVEIPTMIYIKPTNFSNEQESRFRLEFFVENLGSWTEVPMTPEGYQCYTIVRPGNLILQ